MANAAAIPPNTAPATSPDDKGEDDGEPVAEAMEDTDPLSDRVGSERAGKVFAELVVKSSILAKFVAESTIDCTVYGD